MLTRTIVLSLVASAVTAAHAESVQPTRAQVKAETRAAAAAGQLAGNGEQTPFYALPPSVASRAAIKSETIRLGNLGQLPRVGLEPEWKAQRELAATPSTVNRAERKALTRAANESGRLVLPGEAANAPEILGRAQ